MNRNYEYVKSRMTEEDKYNERAEKLDRRYNKIYDKYMQKIELMKAF